MRDTTTSLNALRNAYLAGVSSVLPNVLVPKYVKRDGDTLIVGETTHFLNNNVYIIGFGKAVINMVRPVEEILRNSDGSSHLVRGVISVPHRIRDIIQDSSLLPDQSSKVQIYEGAENNLPDENANYAAQIIVSSIENLAERDLLITLISGGGSALLPLPKSPVTMLEKQEMVKKLSSAGADIVELNTVRKTLSDVKGGKLALKTRAKVVTLILSDVINSPLDIIASGPTFPNKDPPGAALDVLTKYKIDAPSSVMEVMLDHKPIEAAQLRHVTNYVIGDNNLALNAAQNFLQTVFGENCFIVTASLQGNASDIGKSLALLSQIILTGYKQGTLGDCTQFQTKPKATMDSAGKFIEPIESKSEIVFENLLESLHVRDSSAFLRNLARCVSDKKPCCILFGGETTVKVTGTGTGGRNQEMVLAFTVHIEQLLSESQPAGTVGFVSAGTDGIDGPTDAAGASTFWTAKENLYKEAQLAGLKPESFLVNNDSNTFFRNLQSGKYLLKPGHTATNVMDLQLLYLAL
ncbi:MOFRL domain [Trinorchestia longiramus]|nr:MOFRL domain [Trinorchestia longiramus]